MAARRFFANRDFLYANSIAFSIVLSIIPFLTVLVKYAEVDREIIRTALLQFLSAYGFQDTTEILIILDGILNRANAIAGTGTIFMVYAATNAIRHFEDAGNHIFRTKYRPPLYRLSIHIASLILIPGVIILSTGSIRFFLELLRPTQFVSIAHIEGEVWISDTTGKIIHLHEGNPIGEINLREKIEEGATFRDYYFDPETGRSGRYWELKIVSEARRLEKSDFMQVRSIVASGTSLTAITETGVIFYSEDGGATWDYRIFGLITNGVIRNPIFRDMLIASDGSQMILCSSGTQTYVIVSRKENHSIYQLPGLFEKLFYIDQGGMTGFPAGYYATGTGRFVYSTYGSHWIGPFDNLYTNRKVKISSMLVRDYSAYFAGDRGSFWFEREAKKYYPNIRSENPLQRENIHDIIPFGEEGLIVIGENGFFRYSPDGENWYIPEQEIFKNISFHSHQPLANGIMLLGENRTLVMLNPGITMGKADQAGRPMVRFDYKIISGRSEAISYLYSFFLYAVIFIIVVLVYTVVYALFPNVKVHPQKALLGAAIASVILVSFIFLIRIWFTFFTNTAFLYGIWAFIPLGMLMILGVIQITLYGMELTYLLNSGYNREVAQNGQDDREQTV